ncbi:MAG: OsmC family peroxiredoxin [Chloroflexota bacterium]|nr:OsmC family peroxiredoxin [Chloroflexota bacterium]
MQAERRAEVIWEGNLPRGHGHLNVGSGVITNQEITWASRTEREDGKTSPEELIAAAHAGCYAMSLSNTLSSDGHTPERLTVRAVSTFEVGEGGPKIAQMQLNVSAKVAGLDDASFQQAVQKAEQGCPVSNALRNNVAIHVNAQLEP